MKITVSDTRPASIVIPSYPTEAQLEITVQNKTPLSTLVKAEDDRFNVSVGSKGAKGDKGDPGVPEEEMTYSKRTDFITDNLLYRGEAAVGSDINDLVWRIRRITIGTDGDVTEEWANGNADFLNRWVDRTILAYR